MEATKLRDSIAKAKLAEETQRRMTDSIIASYSGPGAVAPVGPRRLLIVEPADQRQWPEAALLGRAVADSLRRMLRSRTKQFTVVDPDSVRAALARSRDQNELVKTFNSDLLITIRLTALPRDSAFLMIQAYDLNAVNAFRSRTVPSRAVPKNEVLANLDAVLLSTLTYLDEISRAPRRPQSPAPPSP